MLTPDQANYVRLQGIYVAQLQQRLANNQITQQFYNDQLEITRDNMPDSSDHFWTTFLSTVAVNAVNPIQAGSDFVDYIAGAGVGSGDGISNVATVVGKGATDTYNGIKSAFSSINPFAAIKKVYNDAAQAVKLYLILLIVIAVAAIFYRKQIIKLIPL